MRNLLIIFILLFFSCSTHKINSNIPFEVIKQSEFGKEQSKQQVLIRTQDEFDKYYQEMFAKQFPKPETPTIDFESEDVIFLHFGSYNYGGNIFDITQIEWRDKDLIVHIHKPKRDENAMVTTVITNPYIFVAIDKLEQSPENIIIEN